MVEKTGFDEGDHSVHLAVEGHAALDGTDEWEHKESTGKPPNSVDCHSQENFKPSHDDIQGKAWSRFLNLLPLRQLELGKFHLIFYASQLSVLIFSPRVFQ